LTKILDLVTVAKRFEDYPLNSTSMVLAQNSVPFVASRLRNATKRFILGLEPELVKT